MGLEGLRRALSTDGSLHLPVHVAANPRTVLGQACRYANPAQSKHSSGVPPMDPVNRKEGSYVLLLAM